jgi:hypothetical protein
VRRVFGVSEFTPFERDLDRYAPHGVDGILSALREAGYRGPYAMLWEY